MAKESLRSHPLNPAIVVMTSEGVGGYTKQPEYMQDASIHL